MTLVNIPALLPREFYLAHTIDVARNLLGKKLCRAFDGALVSGEIVETEAYLFDDSASHSYRGRSVRNHAMFGEAGRSYVYLSYGVHDMLNIVTSDEGVGEAVLIRALMPIDGIEIIRRHTRKPDTLPHRLAAGPGLVAKALAVSRYTENHVDLTSRDSPLWIENYREIADTHIVAAKRIGITKNAEQPWRFYIADCSAVSRK